MEKLLARGTGRGLLFIVSAPAGTGKTTLIQRIMAEFPSVIASISYTTRKPRGEEIPGVHYHFISESAFNEKIDTGDFLEHVTLYGTQYGTSKEWIEEQQKSGKHVVLVIDTQGALQLRKQCPILIFIKPPSLDEQRNRLMKRKTETAESIEKRLARAEIELENAKYYDYQLVNDNLDIAYEILRSIFIAEYHKTTLIRGENG